jgi:hypothetical protein
MKTIIPSLRAVLLSLIVVAPSLHAQLLSNLQKLSPPESRLSVGDPYLTPTNGTDGPKSIVAVDLDGDGKMDMAVANKDGSITLYYGKGDSMKRGGTLTLSRRWRRNPAIIYWQRQPFCYAPTSRGTSR